MTKITKIWNNYRKEILFLLFFILLDLFGVFLLSNVTTLQQGEPFYSLHKFPPEKKQLLQDKNTVVVFGAGMRKDGVMTSHQKDRVIVGLKVYRQNKQIQQILVTGDNGARADKEVQAMKKYMLELGVPREDLIVDPHGYGTYESCYRLSREFGIDSAIVVSQAFHLPRIIYTCSKLGTEIIGVGANLRDYENDIAGPVIRESLARMKAWIQINILKPKPWQMIEAKLGGYSK